LPAQIRELADKSFSLLRRELTALLKARALINSSLKTNDVLNVAMKVAEGFMAAEASSVFELDPARGDISVRLARGKKGVFMKSKRLQPRKKIYLSKPRIVIEKSAAG
jgi:hypothetical protein